MKYRYSSGFALLELMVATIILCGLIYMFIAFTQGQQRQVDTQNVGKHLAIAMNALIAQSAQNGCINNSSLRSCAKISDAFAKVLHDDGFDSDNAIVSISTQ